MDVRLFHKIKYPFSFPGQWSFCCTILFVFLLGACTNPERVGNSSSIEKTDGKVVAISDGDTFRLLTDEKQTVRVRLHGIDAPEKGQDYSTQAREVLSELVFGKEVRLEQKDKDRYGRIVAVVYSNGVNVNEELLRRGMVWHYKEYDKTPAWTQLEQKARKNKAGLWRQPNPTPPWEFRKEKRSAREEQNALAE
ncbi:MAG TPA: thermonuclease family protein [Flavisolibacter sp.]|jgi:endonuclease YncB( thermonuclease family)|nr:thermonuclease family protein [Flavisolibacter sp.]